MASASPKLGTIDMVAGGTVHLGSGDSGRASVISVQTKAPGSAWTGTLTIKATINGTDYVAVLGLPADSTTAATTIAAGYEGITRIDSTGYFDVELVGTALGTNSVDVYRLPTVG